MTKQLSFFRTSGLLPFPFFISIIIMSAIHSQVDLFLNFLLIQLCFPHPTNTPVQWIPLYRIKCIYLWNIFFPSVFLSSCIYWLSIVPYLLVWSSNHLKLSSVSEGWGKGTQKAVKKYYCKHQQGKIIFQQDFKTSKGPHLSFMLIFKMYCISNKKILVYVQKIIGFGFLQISRVCPRMNLAVHLIMNSV